MSTVRPSRLWNDYVFLLSRLLPVDAHIHPKTGNTGSVPLMVCVVEVQLQVDRRSLNQTESGLEKDAQKLGASRAHLPPTTSRLPAVTATMCAAPSGGVVL